VVAALCVAASIAVPADAASGDQLWIKGYAGSRQHGDRATAMALSPDGTTVFVTGEQGGVNSATVAYETGSGARLWTVNHPGMFSPVVAATGTLVFVAGTGSPNTANTYSVSTIAIDATSGAVVWTSTFHGPNGASPAASAITVSPDGREVYVTGPLTSNGSAQENTIAYSANDGTTLWSALWDGVPPGDLSARVVASGARVFVSATSMRAPTRNYATLAYDAANGTHLWTRLYDGADDWDAPVGIALGPQGASVFVTGQSWDGGDADYVTVGYSAADGARLWKSRYTGQRNGNDNPTAITTSPDRTKVYVTGSVRSVDGIGWPDYATVAIDPATGTRLWATRYSGPAAQYDVPIAIVASDRNVFVTGTSASSRQYSCDDGSGGMCLDRDVLTVEYRAGTGAQSWVRRYNGSGDRDDWGGAIAVGPEGQRVYVAGEQVTTASRATFPRWVTIAYDAS